MWPLCFFAYVWPNNKWTVFSVSYSDVNIDWLTISVVAYYFACKTSLTCNLHRIIIVLPPSVTALTVSTLSLFRHHVRLLSVISHPTCLSISRVWYCFYNLLKLLCPCKMRESQLLFPNIIKSIVIDRIIFMYRKLRCGCFLINTMCFLLDFSCCHAHIALSSVVSSKKFHLHDG